MGGLLKFTVPPVAVAAIAVPALVLVAVMLFSGPVSMFSLTGLGILAMLCVVAILVPVAVVLDSEEAAS
jgi:hypothetical protein